MLSRPSLSRLHLWADKNVLEKSRTYQLLHSVCRVIFITTHEFFKNELSLRAAALTFTILLSLVPLLAMSTAVIKGLGGDNQLKQVVYSYVQSINGNTSFSRPGDQRESLADTSTTDQAPSSNLSQHLTSAIDKIFTYVEKTSFATLGSFGVGGMVLSVILVLGNIEMAMNAIWHVVSGRSPMRKIADYLALLVLMPISINIGLAAGTVLESEALLSKFSLFMPVVWIQALILKLIPVFFLTLTLYVIYLFFPNTKVKTFPAMAGAIFAGFFWFEAQNLYIGMQVGVSRYNAIYGSFATLPLFLIWVYFGWIFILLGAQLAFAIQNKDSYQLSLVKAQPSLLLAVAFDVLDYVQESFKHEGKSTAEDFQEKFAMHPQPLVMEAIQALTEHQLIHVTENGDRLKPSIPLEKMERARVIRAILGSSFSDTEGGIKSRMALQAAALSPDNDKIAEEHNTDHEIL